MEAFAKKLRETRKEKRLTQKQRAIEINATDDSVFSWEKGRSQPSLEMLCALCTLLEVSADYLLGREE